MNLSQLKYVVEVSRTHSITQAAENLFMAQPSLSRAIRELEEELGLTIFKRTAKGIVPTPEGEEFILQAADIADRVRNLERAYKSSDGGGQRLSLSAPRASYIAQAFERIVAGLPREGKIDLNYKETNSMRVISTVAQNNYNLGILRYRVSHEEYFLRQLAEKELRAEPIWTFEYVVLFSRLHPLAARPQLCAEELRPYLRLVHGDPYVPSLPYMELKKTERLEENDRCIAIYERSSQMELLSQVSDTYMRCSPVPRAMLERYGLVQRACQGESCPRRDVLITRKNYRMTRLDKQFLEEVFRVRDEVASLPLL